MQTKLHSNKYKRQRGAATLVVSLIILVATTMIVIFTARSAFVEQRMSGNEIRSKQAFAAAQAGFDHAMAYMNDGGVNHAANPAAGALADIIAPQDLSAGSAAAYRVAFCPAATTVVRPCPDAPPTAANFPAAACRNAGGAVVTLPFYSREARIVSCGWSDDNAARHLVTGIVKGGPATVNSPTNTLTAKGGVTVAGNISVVNYYNNLTIWTGDDLVFGNNAGKTYIRDPALNPPPLPNMDDPTTWEAWSAANPIVTPPNAKLVTTTDKDVRGPDVVETDPTLWNMTDDALFTAFMGLNPADYLAQMVPPANHNPASLTGLKGEIIWIDNLNSISTDLGTRLEPVVLIVDPPSGTLDIGGNVDIYGIVYVRGNITTNGGPQIFGAAVVEGTATGAGTFEVIYDPLAAMGTNTVGKVGALPGSWRDWP